MNSYSAVQLQVLPPTSQAVTALMHTSSHLFILPKRLFITIATVACVPSLRAWPPFLLLKLPSSYAVWNLEVSRANYGLMAFSNHSVTAWFPQLQSSLAWTLVMSTSLLWGTPPAVHRAVPLSTEEPRWLYWIVCCLRRLEKKFFDPVGGRLI